MKPDQTPSSDRAAALPATDNNLARAIAEPRGYRHRRLLSLSAARWIDWARASHYRAPELQCHWSVSPGQFDSICEAILLRLAQDWLNEIWFWEAYRLAAEGRTRAEIESALWIANPSEFWASFERYHRCSPEEVAVLVERGLARQDRELTRLFGSGAFPDDYIPPPAWELALYNLTPKTVVKPELCDKPGGDCRTYLLQFLHGRILEGRVSAREAMAELMDAPLSNWLRTKYPKADPDLVADASSKAIVDYCGQPERYDPSRKMTLEGFIRQAAWRKASNLTRDLKLRNQWEELRDPEYFALFETKPVSETEGEWEQTKAVVEGFLKVLNGPDRRLMELIFEGTWNRSLFVEVLGLGDRSEVEQQKELARVKHRLREALRRWIRKKMRRSLGEQTSR